MGMSADKSYTEALRDLQTGKTDLAYTEFQQYLTYYPEHGIGRKRAVLYRRDRL